MSSTNAVNINAPSSSSSSLSSSSSPQLENHKKQHGSTTPAVVPKGGNWNGYVHPSSTSLFKKERESKQSLTEATI
jgi:hypothetical protein